MMTDADLKTLEERAKSARDLREKINGCREDIALLKESDSLWKELVHINRQFRSLDANDLKQAIAAAALVRLDKLEKEFAAL